MRIALCNEVIAPMPFPKPCEYAAKLGYDGLEIAPYTLSDEPHRLGAAQLAAAMARAQESFAAVAERAQKAGVIYCIEPLSSDQTPLINTLEEAAALVTAIGNPSVRTMLDCSSAGRMETAPLPALVDTWLPKGMIAHVQVNDRNRRGPGQGEQRFAPLFAALVRHGYAGDIAVEPFDYVPDGPGAAARAIGYIKGILEALQER